MKINILSDNQTRKRSFLAEHGLSLFIEHECGTQGAVAIEIEGIAERKPALSASDAQPGLWERS
jgi:hypothetical protein